ncbi:MAG: ABC transporter ATP-binding protein [Bacteroidia bacterium]
MSSLLSVQNVSKQFQDYKALDRVSLEVPEGTIFGLLGPNGAGKTTLIRIINQITGPDSGEVLLKGKKLQPDDIAQIGYLPEERGLYRKMEVGEQALYLARLKGLSKAEAMKRLKYWFEKFEIQSWWKKKVEELSKGMAQKVQFIVTVLHEPSLIILDEPFSGFDPINANLIKNEILELKAKGSTIIFSTHAMPSVEELCNHIALINKGQKILDGSVKEIRTQYKTHTWELVFEGNMMAFTHNLWTGAELIDKREEDGLIHARIKLNGKTSINDILTSVLPHITLHGLREIIPSMNEIFISCVKGTNEVMNESFTE